MSYLETVIERLIEILTHYVSIASLSKDTKRHCAFYSNRLKVAYRLQREIEKGHLSKNFFLNLNKIRDCLSPIERIFVFSQDDVDLSLLKALSSAVTSTNSTLSEEAQKILDFIELSPFISLCEKDESSMNRSFELYSKHTHSSTEVNLTPENEHIKVFYFQKGVVGRYSVLINK